MSTVKVVKCQRCGIKASGSWWVEVKPKTMHSADLCAACGFAVASELIETYHNPEEVEQPVEDIVELYCPRWAEWLINKRGRIS